MPAIDEANAFNVQSSGAAWLSHQRVRTGDIVLLYCCGHGASLSSEPVLFLGDLNAHPENPWSFVNIQSLGRALRKNNRIGGAYLFVDACGETIPGFSLAGNQDTRFWPSPAFGAFEEWKVLLISSTPSGILAHDGSMPGSEIRLGRFTQTLVKALNGALIGDWDGRWAVDSVGLSFQLKNLREFYFPGWNDHPFEPGALMSFNEVRHIVVSMTPVVPVKARVSPRDALDGHMFCICDAPPPPLPASDSIPIDAVSNVWRAELSPSGNLCYAIAYKGETCHVLHFTPNKPHFDLQVPIR
jgi:hypothetical protein